MDYRTVSRPSVLRARMPAEPAARMAALRPHAFGRAKKNLHFLERLRADPPLYLCKSVQPVNTRLQLKKTTGSKTAVVLVLSCVVLAQFGITAWGAEDPRRFLAVESWRGDFHHDVSGTYSDPGVNCTEVYTIAQSLFASGVILSNLVELDNLRYSESDSAVTPVQGSVTDKAEGDCTPGVTTIDLDSVYGPFRVGIDTNANQYVIEFGLINLNLVHVDTSGTHREQLAVMWGPAITNALPQSGLSLSGSTTVTLDPNSIGSGIFAPIWAYFSGNMQLVVSWTLTPVVEELEIIVEPAGYAEWKPEGNLDQPDRRGTNTIKVLARFQKKGGGVPAARATRFGFELLNVSAEPGVCMNFPIESPSTAPDLKFEAELNQAEDSGGDSVIVGDNVIEVLAGNQGMLTAQAVVSSFDFGAYGELRVTAKVPGRDPIVGYLKDDPQKRAKVPLPKCQPGSHIADIWKERWGISNKADEADDDDYPEGDGHLGDGYTLYEEYRGFSEDREHVRLKPLRKELFIRNEIGDGPATGEILKFEKASSLGVHYKLRDDEITFGLMNVNHGHAYSGHAQFGIHLRLRPSEQGYSRAVSAPDSLANSTPGSKLRIDIDPAGPGWGIDTATGEALYHLYTASIAHEIAHCCSVWHHGDCDPRWLIWWSEPLDYEGKSLSTPDTLIGPVDERGQPVKLPEPPDSLKVYVGVPRGEHSGDVNCFMCYRVATALRRDNSTTRIKLDSLNLPPRSLFCRSAQATGMNAPPRNLFGDAHAPERGNCAGQICVNDKYMDDEKHDRDYDCP